VTLFRQGIGRLVRRSTDQGVIVVLDPRFLTRSYARLFHAALPGGLRVETVRREELGAAVRQCF
jgi:Rad3-related DNA helicase